MANIDRREALRECIENANGWIVRRLMTDYNSVYPSELVKCEEDRVIGEKLLTVICKSPVVISKTENGYICERK
jgi:hypothetical protein